MTFRRAVPRRKAEGGCPSIELRRGAAGSVFYPRERKTPQFRAGRFNGWRFWLLLLVAWA